MSLAALAAAATVYDTIDEVARDVRMSVGACTAHLRSSGIASVSDSGAVSMNTCQSMIAADFIDNASGDSRAW